MKKALLINDTRSDLHIGCELVVGNLISALLKVGIKVSQSVSRRNLFDQNQNFSTKIAKADLVIINGEGTLHHDKPAAIQLCKIAKLAKSFSKPVHLINAHWSCNVKCREYLFYFDTIFARDSYSYQEIKSQHPSGEVFLCYDLIFLTPSPIHNDHQSASRSPLVTDSVFRDTSENLLKYAIENKYVFYPFGASFRRTLRKNWKLKIQYWIHYGTLKRNFQFYEGFKSVLSGSSYLITGRYHAACLALLHRIPFVGITSNTNKLESLCSDFGLPKESICEYLPDEAVLEDIFIHHKTHAQLIKKKLDLARRSIEDMFLYIAKTSL